MKRSTSSTDRGAFSIRSLAIFVIGGAVITTFFVLLQDHTNSEYYNPGLKLYHEGKYAQAILDFQQDLKIRPGATSDLYHMGTCEIGMGNVAARRKLLEEAKEWDESNTRGVSPTYHATLDELKILNSSSQQQPGQTGQTAPYQPGQAQPVQNGQ